MRSGKWSRRDMLKLSAASAAGLVSEIKLLKADPAQALAQSEMIKTRYSKLFGV